MKVYETYPESIVWNNRRYALTLSFDRVLRCFEAQSDALLTNADKVELQTALLIKRPPKGLKERAELLAAVFELFPKGERNSVRLIDFTQDAALIRTAFFRIGIDLTRDKIHFFQFVELLGDLPKDTALMRVVEIRAKEIPTPNAHNREYLAALQKAKARVAIKMSEEESREAFMQALKNSTIGRG